MKIAQIVCTYPPYYGGMGNVVFQTASQLAALGHEVEVLTPEYYPSEEIKEVTEKPSAVHSKEVERQIDYATRLKPALQYGNAAYIPKIKKELNRFDLVHLHYPFFGVANLVRKWKLAHPEKPLVITYHMDNRSPDWKGLFFKFYAKFWLPRILGVADLLITSSFDFLKSSDAAQIYQKDPSRWVELPFGVDATRFFPKEKSGFLLEKYNLNPIIPTLLFVGGMDKAHYFKGVAVLLEALFLLKKSNFVFQALLVGEGELRKQFELQAKGLGLVKEVIFTGKITDSELASHYNLADLLILPSLNQAEAFGMVLLEAMASGVPVIASDLPGVRTLASDGGVTVPPGNSQILAKTIYDYFDNVSDKEIISEGVRKAVESKYAWEPIVLKLNEFYTQLVSK